MNVAESHPEQSPEDLFGNRNDLQSVNMNRAVPFGLGHGEGGRAVVEGMQHHDFRVAFFHPLDGVDAGEAVHTHGEVFSMVFDNAQGEHHRDVFVDGFTDLIRKHIEVLHDFSP